MTYPFSFSTWRVSGLAILCATLEACHAPTADKTGHWAVRHLQLAGCYALYDSAARLFDASHFNSSPYIRLDTMRVGRAAAADAPRLVVRLTASGARDTSSATAGIPGVWAPDSTSDSIRIAFPSMLGGAEVILAVAPQHPDTLWGRTEDLHDYGPPFVQPRGSAYAVRIACRRAAAFY